MRTNNPRRHRARTPLPKRRGAVLVEFALVLPTFILIVFTCFEFARLNMLRNLMQDAAYYASRACIVPGATESEASAEAMRILSSMGARDVSILVNDGAGLDDSSTDITVRIEIPISSNALLTSKFTGNMILEAEATMRTERYDGFYDPNL